MVSQWNYCKEVEGWVLWVSIFHISKGCKSKGVLSCKTWIGATNFFLVVEG